MLRERQKKERQSDRTKNARHVSKIHESHSTSKDLSSEYDKEDRIQMQKITFDTDSFPIGVETFSSRFMANNIYQIETHVPNNRNNKGRIKVADGGSMEVKGRGMVA